MGLRAKGWGSTMLRERVRQRRRAWVGDGMVVCWGLCGCVNLGRYRFGWDGLEMEVMLS